MSQPVTPPSAPPPPSPPAAARDSEWPLRKLSGRGHNRCAPSGPTKADPHDRALRHGHATMAALAILKPKLVPGARLVKNDSLSFCLSFASSGFGFATFAVHPVGAETSFT